MKKILISLTLIAIAAVAVATVQDQPEKVFQTNTVYHGNIKSKIFHKSTCRYFDCKDCKKVFNSRSEAINAGYRPCKVCKP